MARLLTEVAEIETRTLMSAGFLCPISRKWLPSRMCPSFLLLLTQSSCVEGTAKVPLSIELHLLLYSTVVRFVYHV